MERGEKKEEGREGGREREDILESAPPRRPIILPRGISGCSDGRWSPAPPPLFRFSAILRGDSLSLSLSFDISLLMEDGETNVDETNVGVEKNLFFVCSR